MNSIRGLQVLKNSLPGEAMADFYLCEARILEYLHHSRLYDHKSRPAAEELDSVLYALDQLALKYHKRDFRAMCEEPMTKLLSASLSLTDASHLKQVAAQEKQSHPTNVSVQQLKSGIELISLTHIPTASCYFKSTALFPPPVTIVIDNTHAESEPFSLRVNAFIEGYSDLAIKSKDIVKGKKEQLELAPVFKPAALATLNEIRSATLHVTIEYTSTSQHWHYENTEPVQLLARNTAILAVQTPDGSNVTDLTNSLAAWVTPHRTEIEGLLNKAAKEYHPLQKFIGYEDADESSVQEQAMAIFDVLRHDAHLIYINSRLYLGGQSGQIAQRIRLPTEVIRSGGSANCLDGAVLFASLLELAMLEPVLVLVSDHALVGWRTAPEIEQYEFLDTTCIGQEDFAVAQHIARELVQGARSHGDFQKPVFALSGFARLIDIVSCHQRGIEPLE